MESFHIEIYKQSWKHNWTPSNVQFSFQALGTTFIHNKGVLGFYITGRFENGEAHNLQDKSGTELRLSYLLGGIFYQHGNIWQAQFQMASWTDTYRSVKAESM